MKMNETNVNTEQNIALIDCLLLFLEKWRCWVAVGILFAVLVSGLKYSLDMREYQNLKNHVDEVKFETELMSQSETPFYQALTQYSRWMDRRSYFNNSFIMKVDAAREHRLVLRYYVKAKKGSDTDVNTIGNYYTTLTSDNVFLKKMADAMAISGENQYIRELISINPLQQEVAAADTKGTAFTVLTILVNDADRTRIRNTVTEYLYSVRDKLSKVMGDYTIELISTEEAVVDNQARINSQMEAYTAMLRSETAFFEQYNAMTNTEREELNQILMGGEVEKWLENARLTTGDAETVSDTTEDHENEDGIVEEIDPLTASGTKASKPSFKIIFAVLGFFVGIFLYAAAFLFRLLTDTRIRNEKEIRMLTGVRSYGGIYEYPYKSLPARFAHCRMVYNLRHKKAGRPEMDAKKTALAIAARAGHIKAEGVSLITLGKSGIWEERILSRQKKILSEERNLEVRRIRADQGVSSINEDDFRTMPPAVIVLLSGITTPAMVSNLLLRLEEYDIPVVGTEFLEGA